MLSSMLTAMRPRQWYKNLVIFAGLIFAGNLGVLPLFVKAAIAFLIFCLISSAGYILNDVTDVKADSCDPEKSKRPIPSGKMAPSFALLLSACLFAVGNVLAFLLNHEFGLCAVTYSLVTVLYSVLLKQYALIDVITISVGFVIRAGAGAVVIQVYISPWLILCAFMLALFLALCKRKQEKSSLYSPQVLDHLLSITTALVIMSYSLYTFLRAAQEMMITIPLVLYGLFRFLTATYEEKTTAQTQRGFLDIGLVLTFLLWGVLVFVIVYAWE